MEFKKIYKDNGCQYTKDGQEASEKVRLVLEELFKELLDDGYAPYDARLLLYDNTMLVSAFEVIMRY